jgi:hypothetical protein
LVVELAQVAAGGVHSAELQQPADGMQAPPHALKLALHLQAFALQLAFDWQSPLVQHASTSIQAPLHDLVPLLQTHWLLEQLLPSSQSALVQQALSEMHLVPHFLNPLLHTKSHAPLQTALELAGTGQVVQLAPHAVGLLSSLQRPLQSWDPVGQTPLQASPESMQVPTHSFFPLGQLAPHEVPSQVASPPVGVWQALQATPQ